jgi:hypothetical protein
MRRLFQRFHRFQVRAGSMAHPGDTLFRQCANGRRGVCHHNVERERRRFGEARDQSDIGQAWGKQPIRAGLRICVCALDRLGEHRVVMLFGWTLEKDIRPGVEEEADIARIGSLAGAPDTIGLILRVAEFSVGRKAVLQVTANSARADGELDAFRQRFRFAA